MTILMKVPEYKLKLPLEILSSEWRYGGVGLPVIILHVMTVLRVRGQVKTFNGNKNRKMLWKRSHRKDPFSELLVWQQVKSTSVIEMKDGKMPHLATAAASMRWQSAQYLHPPTNFMLNKAT